MLGDGHWHVLVCLCNHSVENIGWRGTGTKIYGQPTKMKMSHCQPKRRGNRSNKAMICRTRLLANDSVSLHIVMCQFPHQTYPA